MSDQKHRAPQHGGSERVAFDGGQTVRRQLPFRALAVNIDNWSPYWYKLNPVEEYIPPFQHGINIRLPLISDYEFVPIAPPGLQQTLITTTTGIPGNTKPLIAVFSSYDTNNDAGFSALQASANIGVPFIGFVGPQLIDIDLTIYDGLYLSLTSSSRFVVEIDYLDNPTSSAIALYRRIMHINSRLFLVIPKVTRFVRISISNDPNRPIALGGSYSARPFFGSLPFSAQLLTAPNAVVVPQDNVEIIGSGSAQYTVTGLENALLVVRPNGGMGVTINTIYWIKVFALNLADVNTVLLYDSSFLGAATAGNVPGALIVPLNGLLRGQIDQILVNLTPVDGGVTLATAITEVSMHQGTAPALDTSNYDKPHPYILRGGVITAVGTNLMVTVPVGGKLTCLSITVTAPGAAGTQLAFGIGNGVAVSQFFGDVPAIVANQTNLNQFSPLRMDSGFSTIWVFCNVAGVGFNYDIYVQ